jgi:hypothetical protein
MPPIGVDDATPMIAAMEIALQSATLMSRLFGMPMPVRSHVTRRFAATVPKGATREIPFPPGRVTLHCRQGEAWITHDGDPRDVLLHADESYTADNPRRMTVHAMRGDCLFDVQVEDAGAFMWHDPAH